MVALPERGSTRQDAQPSPEAARNLNLRPATPSGRGRGRGVVLLGRFQEALDPPVVQHCAQDFTVVRAELAVASEPGQQFALGVVQAYFDLLDRYRDVREVRNVGGIAMQLTVRLDVSYLEIRRSTLVPEPLQLTPAVPEL